MIINNKKNDFLQEFFYKQKRMSNTYTPTQQPVSSYGLFKQIYLSWMKDYGQYICSKGND